MTHRTLPRLDAEHLLDIPAEGVRLRVEGDGRDQIVNVTPFTARLALRRAAAWAEAQDWRGIAFERATELSMEQFWKELAAMFIQPEGAQS